VRIKEEQLDALVRFDKALAHEIGAINEKIAALASAVKDRTDINAALDQLNQKVADLNTLFSKRSQVIETPGLLDDPAYAPPADTRSADTPPADAGDLSN
jgi:hypothetical protein